MSGYSGGSCETDSSITPSFVGSTPSARTSWISVVRHIGSWLSSMAATILRSSEPMSDGRHSSCNVAIGCSGSGITMC